MGGYKWTEAEEDVLREKYGYKPISALAKEELERRSENSIKTRANQIGLSSDRRKVAVWKMEQYDKMFPDKCFNHYIVGLTDGEGCFTSSSDSRDWDSTTFTYTIKMKNDEDILRELHDYFSVGSVYNYGEDWSYTVSNNAEIGGVIIPFFLRNKPKARKSEQFDKFVQDFEEHFEIEFTPTGLITHDW